jgi:2-polyprenyl-6-methoxyphenol hydroxylase-like FAD-dependent oxidoreductase
MRILVVGAGPAGLYFAYLFKKRNPRCQLRVVEQNAADSTFGFGVVFSDKALEFLRADDVETYDAIVPRMEAWSDLTVVHRGTPVVIDGIGFAAIGRLAFLGLLRQRLASVGIRPEFEHCLAGPRELEGYDLVVAALAPPSGPWATGSRGSARPRSSRRSRRRSSRTRTALSTRTTTATRRT